MTIYMPLFRACSTSRTLNQLHAHLIVTGLRRDPLASTKLIESYAQMGAVSSSKLVFDTSMEPDSFMWGVLIKTHVWNGLFREAILMYHKMLHSLTQLNRYIFPTILRACSAINDLGMGEKVHARIIKSGFESDPFIETSLLGVYGEMGCLDNAREIFDRMLVRDVVSWSSMLSSYVQNGQANEGLEIFRKMIREGLEVDPVILLSVAEACGELALWRVAKSLHGYIVRMNMHTTEGALQNSLITMYGKCGDVCSAEKLFYHADYQNVSSWTAIISCYNQNGYYEQALTLFSEMQESDVEPNAITLMSTLCSCARLSWLRGGQSVHASAIRSNIDPDSDLLRSALIDMYSNCRKPRDCHKLFDTVNDSNLVLWNMFISGNVREGMFEEALMLFVQVLRRGLLPDSFTLSTVLSACADIGFSQLGCQIHSYVIKTVSSYEFVQNSLIDMYSKCGFVNLASRIFGKTQEKSVVTWNTMMCGFSQNGYSKEAIELFDNMYVSCLEINEVTFLSVIRACADVGYVEKGKWVHHKLITLGVRKDMHIDTTLTDMYARCGDLLMAQAVFDSMMERSMVSWSAMIGGYGMHGHVDAAISLFNNMVESGVQPNDVTLMNILSACSHAGYVEQGKYYFDSMVRDYGIKPNSEHFACLVDLLSRAGDLDGAYEVIKSMPFPADASIWGAFVNGCRIHQRMDVMKSIETDLIDVKTDDTGYYTLLSNVYAEGGEWKEFRIVRSMMRSTGLNKVQGYSMIEVDKRVHRFGANDRLHPQMEEIFSLLDKFQLLVQDGSNEQKVSAI